MVIKMNDYVHLQTIPLYRPGYFTLTIVSSYVSGPCWQNDGTEKWFRWRYEQNQLSKFVKNTIMAIAKC